MKLSKNSKYSLVLLLLCFLFFGLYSFNVWSLWLPNLYNFRHLIFNWPDANANYFFAKVFAESHVFYFPESLNLISDNLLHTRSINVYDGNLVPISFLPSIFLFGIFFKVLGGANILWLTPALASVSVFIAYKLIYKIFGDIKISFISALLLLPLAPWLYFSNVVMLPTILFIFLVLLGWLFITHYFHKQNLVYWTLGSIFLTLAVLVRPTELVWLTVISSLVLYWNKHKLHLGHLFWGGFIFVLFISGFLYLNKITYGAYLATGYSNLQTGNLPTETNLGATSIINYFKLLFVPFGFNWRLVASNFVNYILEIIWPFIIFILAGLYFLWLKLKNKQRQYILWQRYLIIFFITSFLILLYYASWDLADPLVKHLNKISISYIRYFMPIYLLMIPVVAYGFKRLFFAGQRFNRPAIGYFMLSIVAIVFIRMAFYSENDGLIKNRENIIEYYYQYQNVSKSIPANSIIISDRSDKVFFPKYKVVAPQGDLPLWPRVANLLAGQNVYFYTNKTENALETTKQKASESGLYFADGVDIYEDYKIYKIIK